MRLSKLNMFCISISDCLTSRYSDPKKFSGIDSWNNSPFTITRSPTVRTPTMQSQKNISNKKKKRKKKEKKTPLVGLEPTTFELEVQCANPLRHRGCVDTTKFYLVVTTEVQYLPVCFEQP